MNGPTRALIASAVMSALTACGGGGSGETVNPSPPSPASLSVQGEAFKGLIRDASVEACEVGSTPPRCGTGTIDSVGSYNLQIDDYRGGPVLVTVRGGGNATSTCDSALGCGPGIAFGQPVPLGSDFTLRTLLPLATGSTINAPVTPYTDLVAELAGPGVGSIRDAANLVSALLGNVDILSLYPADITQPADPATAEASDYALFLAGVAALAPENPATAITSLRSLFAGGSISGAALSSLMQSVRQQSVLLGIPQRAGLLSTAELIARSLPDDGLFQPPPPSAATDVAIAKDSVAAIRLLVQNALDLEQPLAQFATELGDVGTGLDAAAPALAGLLDGVSVVVSGAKAIINEDGCNQASTMLSAELELHCSSNDFGSTTLRLDGRLGDAQLSNLELSFPTEALGYLLGDGDAPVAAGPVAVGLRLSSLSPASDPQLSLLSIPVGELEIELASPLNLPLPPDYLESVSPLIIASLRLDFDATIAVSAASLTGQFGLQVGTRSCDDIGSLQPEDCIGVLSLTSLGFSGTLEAGGRSLTTFVEYSPVPGEILATFGESGIGGRLSGTLTLGLELAGLGANSSAASLVIVLETATDLDTALSGRDLAGSVRANILLTPGQLLSLRFEPQPGTLDGARLFFRANGLTELRLELDALGNSTDGSSLVGGIYLPRADGEITLATISRGPASILLIRYTDGTFESLL